jgi:uncharacterized protein (DUF1919 family)
MLQKIQHIINWSLARLRGLRYFFDDMQMRRKVIRKDFTIISSNCWGTKVYKDMHVPYHSPFVNCFLHAPCYLQVLKNLNDYLISGLTFKKESKYPITNELRKKSGNYYPIGELKNTVEIHFIYAKSEKEAETTWYRRRDRVNRENLFISFTDRDLCTLSILEEFDNLPYPQKVVFTAKNYPQIKSSVWIKECQEEPFVPDLFTHAYLYKKYFDVADWLNGGTGKRNT